MIAIVDYGVGNLASIRNMFAKVGAAATITSEPGEIAAAERLVLPGVGAFDHAMENLERSQLIGVLEEAALAERRPVLAICLGMQLLTRRSEEGEREGLGWLAAETLRFRPQDATVKVPHMGWSRVAPEGSAAMFDGIEDPQFYFLHSFYVRSDDAADIAGTCDYAGVRFTAAAVRDNLWSAQFHPEKSHRFGMQLFRNFAAA